MLLDTNRFNPTILSGVLIVTVLYGSDYDANGVIWELLACCDSNAVVWEPL